MIVEHSRIIRIQGDIITVPAEGISYGELAEVKSRHGVSLAQVIRLKGHEVSLQVFAEFARCFYRRSGTISGTSDAGRLRRCAPRTDL